MPGIWCKEFPKAFKLVVGILGIPRSQNTIRGRLHAAIGQRRNRPRVGSDTDVLINLGGEHGGTVRA